MYQTVALQTECAHTLVSNYPTVEDIQEHTVGYARNLLLEMCTTQIHLVLLFSVLEDGLLRLDFLQKLAEEKIMRKKIEMLNNHEIDI